MLPLQTCGGPRVRTLIVPSRRDQEAPALVSVCLVLTNGAGRSLQEYEHQDSGIMQVVMDEEEAQLGSADIALTLAASHVHGVWEERMPLGLEAALSIGCVTELLPSVRHQPLSEGFMLSALKV